MGDPAEKQGNSQPSPSADSVYARLIREIDAHSAKLKDIKAHLNVEPWPATAFKVLSEVIYNIGGAYRGYVSQVTSPYYELFGASGKLSKHAAETVRAATEAAELFDIYRADPRQYNRIKAWAAIDPILDELINLRAYCSSKETPRPFPPRGGLI